MKRIVLGVDGSEASATALRWATEIATKAGANLVAVHAIPERLNELPLDQRQKVKTAIDRQLDTWVASAVEAGAVVEPLVCEDDARAALLHQAADGGADLVVVGRTGDSTGPGVLHLGSVAEHLAHHVSCPLAVVTASEPPVRRIALGVDGSPESIGAARWSAELADALGASVIGISIVEPIAEWTPASSPKNWRRGVEKEIEGWGVAVTDLGIELSPVAERGLHPADGLLQVADAHDADMLVVGTRGVGGFSGLRVGGVALKVLHAATRPVVLVPPGT